MILTRPRALRAACALLLALGACDTATGPAAAADGVTVVPAFSQGAGMPVRPVTPALQTRAPQYPAIAVYIVYREWVNRNPGLTTLSLDDPRYQRYVEKRMRELYPHRGYAGMMRDAVAEARRNEAAWRQYEREMREYERRRGSYALTSYAVASTCSAGYADPAAGQDASWSGQEEFAVPPDSELPTIQMEVDSLQLVGSQVDDIYYYESLANGTYAGGGGGGGGGGCIGCEAPVMHSIGGSVDDRIRAAAAGSSSTGGEVGVQSLTAGAITVGVGLVGWKAYRAATAHVLAREKSTSFYPDLPDGATKRDAHRHIYWSMMLRRWIGAAAAKTVTDWRENDTNSYGPARVMDFHNNAIGRTHRYNSFRGHWLWDRWDTSEWAVRVRDYVNNESANAEFIPEWAGASLTTEQAWERKACVPDAKYIFFSRTTI